MRTDAASEIERWHITKAVPVSLLVALLLQFFGGVWIARGLVADLQETSRRVTALETARISERVSERLSVVENQVSDTRAATLRIEADVRKLVERKP